MSPLPVNVSVWVQTEVVQSTHIDPPVVLECVCFDIFDHAPSLLGTETRIGDSLRLVTNAEKTHDGLWQPCLLEHRLTMSIFVIPYSFLSLSTAFFGASTSVWSMATVITRDFVPTGISGSVTSPRMVPMTV